MTTKMTQQEANELIATKMNQVSALIRECEAIAYENDVSFSMDVAYGMGGWYNPTPKEGSEEWTESSSSNGDYGWQSSSQSC